MPLEKVEFNESWYVKFVSHTDEKDLLVDKIKTLLQGRKIESCLEIGLGISPYFANKLRDLFKRYVIIEKRLIKNKLPEGVELINADWEKTKIEEKFDVIIASHVIYYFNNKKESINKILKLLKPGGIAFFAVNGKTADYGPLKNAFAKMIKTPYIFTYDELMKLLGEKFTKEYTVPSTISFSTYEDLFETLKISFDQYPEEYQELKEQIIKYMRNNIKGNKFIIDQKIIEVRI